MLPFAVGRGARSRHGPAGHDSSSDGGRRGGGPVARRVRGAIAPTTGGRAAPSRLRLVGGRAGVRGRREPHRSPTGGRAARGRADVARGSRSAAASSRTDSGGSDRRPAGAPRAARTPVRPAGRRRADDAAARRESASDQGSDRVGCAGVRSLAPPSTIAAGPVGCGDRPRTARCWRRGCAGGSAAVGRVTGCGVVCVACPVGIGWRAIGSGACRAARGNVPRPRHRSSGRHPVRRGVQRVAWRVSAAARG